VAVAVVVVTCLILRGALKTVADYQPQLQEKVERVIERCPAYGKLVFIGQLLAELIEREMTFRIVDSTQDGITFWRLAVIIHFEVAVKNPLYSGFYTIFHPSKLHKPLQSYEKSSEKPKEKTIFFCFSETE
jgi:hypothetical protein